MTTVEEAVETVESTTDDSSVESANAGSTDGLFDVATPEQPQSVEPSDEPVKDDPVEKKPEEAKPEEEAKAEPVESESAALPQVADEPEKPTFTFHPQDGSPPITIPAVQAAIPEGKKRWFFWKLRKLEGLDQPIFWLDQAGIPDWQQERIMLLPDQEWARFYEEWMADGAGVTPGE